MSSPWGLDYSFIFGSLAKMFEPDPGWFEETVGELTLPTCPFPEFMIPVGFGSGILENF